MTSRFKILILFVFTLFLMGNACAQFYVSSPVCVQGGTFNPMTGTTEGCQKPTSFFDTDTASVSSVWQMGNTDIITGRNFNYTYPTIGTFTVSLLKTYKNGTTSTVNKTVTVGTYPNQPMFNKKVKSDSSVCSGSSVKLDPFGIGNSPGNVSYRWFPKGQTTSTITVDSSGCYSVDVIDNVSGCVKSAQITIKMCYKPPNTGPLIEKWFLGSGEILEFTTRSRVVPKDSLKSTGTLGDSLETLPPTQKTLPANPLFKTLGSSAMVYDKEQKLAFYSDGFTLFSGEDNAPIKNLDGTNYNVGGIRSPQAMLIIPKPNCNTCDYSEFLIFTVDSATNTLRYSVIDKRLNNKKGIVTESNIPVLYPVSNTLTGGLNSDEVGFQIRASTPQLGISHLINIDTLGVIATQQTIGTPSTTEVPLAVSPNNKKVARGVVIAGKNYVQIFDQDPVDKSLTNGMLIDLNIPAPPNIYSISFSPENEIIYVSIAGDPSKNQLSYFIQLALFDGTAAQIAAGKIVISSSATETYGSILRGPLFGNGAKNIYLSIKDKNFIPYVQSPDVKGNATTIGFTLAPGSTLLGQVLDTKAQSNLPNLIKSPESQEGDGLSADYDGNCFGLPTTMSTQGVCSPLKNEAKWFFPDGTTKEGLQVSHTFKKLGWNNVKLVVTVYIDSKIGAASGSTVINNATKIKCTEVVYEGRIFIKPSPTLTLVTPVYVCLDANEKKIIDPKPKGGKKFEFDWTTSLGTTITKDSVFKAEIPAPVYKLNIKNELGCSADTTFAILEGCDPIIQIPNVFTPNSDSKNDSFILLAKYITDAKLMIFNRWGELVFKTDDPANDFWDGSFRGSTFDGTLYPYILKYSSLFYPEKGEQSIRGSIIILK